MKTIVIVGGIVLAGATVIAVVQNDKKKDAAPAIHQTGGAPAQPAGSTSAAPALNPAHGLAGHRCDLPVGAPLTAASGTSAPVQAPQNIKINPGPQQPAPAALSAPPAAGANVNPAHGLAGHRCGLPVGAPLTSATGTAAPAPASQNIKMSPAPQQAPATSSPPPAGVKVNPAHGLPGHRCDLAVGAPLA